MLSPLMMMVYANMKTTKSNDSHHMMDTQNSLLFFFIFRVKSILYEPFARGQVAQSPAVLCSATSRNFCGSPIAQKFFNTFWFPSSII